MSISDWAARWGVPTEAVAELIAGDKSEADAVAKVRWAAGQAGWHLWRNNVGACKDSRGNFIRYGLANDSTKLNAVIKSSDLIGIRSLLILPSDVGRTVGLFVAREVKRPGWIYKGTPREQAQKNFIDLVNRLGGDAKFTTGDL